MADTFSCVLQPEHDCPDGSSGGQSEESSAMAKRVPAVVRIIPEVDSGERWQRSAYRGDLGSFDVGKDRET